MKEETRHNLKVGRNMGALLGLIVFLVFGLPFGFYFGSYGSVLILSHLGGASVNPGVLERMFIVAGTMLGIMAAAIAAVFAGSVIGTVFAFVLDAGEALLGEFKKAAFPAGQTEPVIRQHPRMAPEKLAEIRSMLSFLEAFRNGIHSMAVVGSAAFDAGGEGSDIDIVIVCREDSADRIRGVVAEKEIDEELAGGREEKIEYTILSGPETEAIFRMSSPFAHSIYHGVVFEDDGYLEDLFKALPPAIPGRTYLLKTLKETIAFTYYGSIASLDRLARVRQCTKACCEEKAGCEGPFNAENLARVVMRMLYVTLPARGYMPLLKSDVLFFVGKVYGRKRRVVLERAVEMLRGERPTIYFTEYNELKGFARALFRETLGTLGKGGEVVGIIRDAASMVRGDFAGTRDKEFWRAVI